MHGDPLAATVAVTIVAGTICQVLARKARLPAIVPLLIAGVLLGPDVAGRLGIGPDGNGLVQPRSMGDGLRTVIGLSVAIILFEGGMTLKTESLRHAGPIRNLCTIGAGLTWLLCALVAHLLFPLGWSASLLFGALVIVTGPTVIMPLLRSIRARRRVATILRGEAVVVDPIGALAAVLVLEFILAAQGAAGAGIDSSADVVMHFGYRVGLGLVIGAVGAVVLYWLLRDDRRLHADLRNLLVLAGAVGLFTLSEAFAEESGVLTVTIGGVILGMLHPPGLEDIEEFKGNIVLLTVSVVFILLAADLEVQGIWNLGWPGLLLLGAVIFVVRPVSVWLSTMGSDLLVREKLFLAWIAPRGIVAAMAAGLFAILLEDAGVPGGGAVRDLTFLVIFGTVLVQGPTARWVGGWLGVLERAPDGWLIVGGTRTGRAIGAALQQTGVRVLLLDTNEQRVQMAREAGLAAREADALDDRVIDTLDLDGIGNLLAITPNSTINRIAARNYLREFEPARLHTVHTEESPDPSETPVPEHHIFGDRVTLEEIEARLRTGARVAWVELHEAGTAAEHTRDMEGSPIALAYKPVAGDLVWIERDDQQVPAGVRLLHVTNRPAPPERPAADTDAAPEEDEEDEIVPPGSGNNRNSDGEL